MLERFKAPRAVHARRSRGKACQRPFTPPVTGTAGMRHPARAHAAAARHSERSARCAVDSVQRVSVLASCPSE